MCKDCFLKKQFTPEINRLKVGKFPWIRFEAGTAGIGAYEALGKTHIREAVFGLKGCFAILELLSVIVSLLAKEREEWFVMM